MVNSRASIATGICNSRSVAEVTGYSDEGVEVEEIFRYERTGLDESRRVVGRFVYTGFRPQFMSRLQARGIELPEAQVFGSE